MTCKPCMSELAFRGVASCPGDDGYTTILFQGELIRVSKDDDVVELFGALDEASASLLSASHRLEPGAARVARLLRAAVMLVASAAATGRDYTARVAKLVSRAYRRMFALGLHERPMGWLMDTAVPELENARVLIRRAERIAVRVARRGYRHMGTVSRLLNWVSNAVFDLERISGARFAARLA